MDPPPPPSLPHIESLSTTSTVTSESQPNVSEECPDCGGTFPLRQGSGPCPKCIKLAPHHRNTAEYDDISVSKTIYISQAALPAARSTFTH